MLEPHADWNQLMDSPALSIQAEPSTFDIMSPFYCGDQLHIQLENGTVVPNTEFQANLNVFSDPSCIQSAQDFYNFFVVYDLTCDTPDSDSDTSSTSSATGTATASSPTSTGTGDDDDDGDDSDGSDTENESDGPSDWVDAASVYAYPAQPDVSQPNLGSGGWITGYFLNATSTGVLSIPSFQMTGEALESFSDTIGTFLDRAKQAGMSNIVIDLQQNGGGDELLAVDAFKHFFPNLDPYGGSRLRSFDMADTLGNTFTQFFQTILNQPNSTDQNSIETMIVNPWAVLNLINAATGRYFTSWSEFAGPVEDDGDFFSEIVSCLFLTLEYSSHLACSPNSTTQTRDSTRELR